MPRNWIVFGELDLNGEVRPVANGEERLREAAKQGFRHALIARKNAPRGVAGMDITPVKALSEALAAIRAIVQGR